MSSSFGGGGGFGGSQNTVRYAIVIDDSQVNSKLQNFQNQLSQLGSATQSSTSGLQTFNTNLQQMDSNLQSTGTDLDAINNNFRSMDSSVQSTSREMGVLSNNFKGASGGLTQFNTLQGTVGDGTKTLGQKMKGAGGFIKDNALAFGAVSSSIIGLVQDYTGLQKAQNTLERARNIEITQGHTLEKLNRDLTEAQQKYGAGSQQAADVQTKINDLTLKHNTQLEKISIMQQQVGQREADFTNSLIGRGVFLASGVAQIASSLPTMAKGIKGLGSAIAGLGTAAFAASLYVIPLLIALASAPNLIKQGQNLITSLDPKQAEIDRLKAMKENILELLKAPELMDPNTWSHIFMPEATKQMHLKTIKDIDARIAQLGKTSKTASKDATSLSDTFVDITPKGEKLASSINAVSNEMLGILPYSQRVKEEFKKTSAEVEIVGHQSMLAADSFSRMRGQFANSTVDISKLGGEVKNVSQDYLIYNQAIKDGIRLSDQAKTATIQHNAETEKFGDVLIVTATAAANMQNMIQNDITAIEGMDQAMVDSAASANKAQAALEQAFGADIGSKVDKMLQKFKKFADKDIDLFINVRADKQALDQSVGMVIDGLTDYMTSDKAANQVGEGLVDMINKSFKGKKKTQYAKDVIEYIEWAISQPNTDVLLNKLKTDIEKGNPINVPAKLAFENLSGGNNSAENEMNGIDSLMIPVPSVTVTPKTIKIADVPGGSGGWGISPLTKGGELLKMSADIEVTPTSVTVKDTALLELGIQAEVVRQSVEKSLQSMQTAFANLSNEGSNSMSLLAKSSSKNMSGLSKNMSVGAVGSQKLQTGLANLANEGSKSLNALAKASSKSMNGLINNVNAGTKAVNALKSAISGLKNKTVTVTYKQVGSPQSKGGVYSFAKGGMVSAAGGLTTSNGPTHFVYGDNPGGRETLAFIPHNDPGPTLNKIAKLFGGGNRSGGGSETVNINLTLPISGSEFINERNLRKMIKLELGKNRDRFM